MEAKEKEVLENFYGLVESFISSKIILADKKIPPILKCIASNKVLYELIERVMVDFDFKRELNLATQVFGSFSLPAEPEKAVALIFCILVQIDSGEMDLIKFIGDNFKGGESIYESFYRFNNEVMMPFMLAVKHVYENPGVSNKIENNIEESLNENEISVESEEKIRAILEKNYIQVETFKKIKEGEKIDILNFLKGYIKILSARNKENIFVTFIAYRIIFNNYKKLGVTASELGQLLANIR